ncbi:MAG: protein kinase [Kofleriaceae bacterium]|nr:protein kinase [Kofleriaceae bacterium]
MIHQCPACQRSFAEPGFCPYDGKPLVETAESSVADQPTVLSASMKAQSATQIELGLAAHKTVQGVGSTGVSGVVATPAPAENTNKLNAVSAHEGHAIALGMMRKKGENEYDALVGQTLDARYYVQRKIGEGGMGVVFAVKHAVIERPLAIKVLKREVMRDKATIQRFVQEAKAASRIGHPNIVDVTDFGKTPDGMTYSVMEYVDGTTLSRTIKHAAPLPAERMVRIASQIARALVAAHGKGIVHRDLKPENVFLVDRDGRPDFVKIVDFGIAKVQPVEGTQAGPRLTRQGAVFGTPEYMAPEQAAGRNDTDHRVDVYALGTIMYEMLVGKTPHKGDSMIRTIAMQMLDPIVPPTKARPSLDIAPSLEAIVMKALEKKREDRYDTMADLLAALENQAARIAASPTQMGTLPAVNDPNAVPPATAVTGLPALPPGADLGIEPSPAAPIVSTDATRPRRPKPATRPLHEPEFVAPGTPVSFSHVYDEPAIEPEKPSRWPMIFAGVLVLALGAGGTIFILSRMSKDDVVGQTARDAALVVEVHTDAGVVETPADAMVVIDLPPDAGTRVATVRGDAGVGGLTVRPPTGKGMVTIEVLTRPGDAEVFIGRNFRGPSGTKITDRFGTKAKIECKTDRMKGSVEVVFDGKVTAIMCTATRDRFCVPGLKNPYDDCEEAPEP